MEKNKLLEKLAIHYGIAPDKVTCKEHQEYLEVLGINTENQEALELELLKAEEQEWKQIIPVVKVIKHRKIPTVTISLPESELNKSYEWSVQEEGGKHHYGEFYASHLTPVESKTIKAINYHKIELFFPVRLDMGYHTLKIKSETGDESFTKLIVVPSKSYKPLALEKNENIKGVKFSLYKENPFSEYRISSYKTLQSVINYAKSKDIGIVGVDSINQWGRIAYSTLLIDIDDAINFIEDKEIKLKILSEDLQESLKEIQDAEEIQLQAILEHKTKLFKLIYNSFRENHIKNNTQKSQDFFHFIYSRGYNLRKQALFEAIKEYLLCEDPKLTSWQEWPDDYKDPNSESILLFENNNIETIQFYEFLQWLADIQLSIAGRTSWINKLAIGLYVDWNFQVNPDEAECWLKQDYYNGILNPNKLKADGYKYITEMIVPNMLHTGAIKLNNLKKFNEYNIYEDILGIIALESHRQKSVIIVEEKEELLENYGFYTENEFEIQSIPDKNLTEFFEEALAAKQLPDKDTEYHRRIQFERIPQSVYRLQFNQDFTFNDAKNIIPYLKELGISHCYASPLLRASTGSMHGYDIINHAELNPEIGTMQEFNEFVDTLHYHDMGLIVDIVPNHMGVGKENKWWMDVLENGQASKYASFFDIDWEPLKKELKGKVLVPVLGDHYGSILTSGQFKFHFNQETGKLKLSYWDHEFPINPSSYPIFLEHRSEVLESRIGSNNRDYLEYLSIINVFKKLPGINETSQEKIFERNMEKDITSNRLADLCKRSPVISGFIQENLVDFQCKPNDPISCNRIHNLLEEQAYRLAYWRVSIDVINYRRFFDVNHLIGLRTEDPLVMNSTHSLILDLIEQEKIEGLRLDHPDGLLDPTNYFKKLQSETAKRLGINFDPNEAELLGSEKLPIYVIAEKILAPFEKIPKNWAINGTVGYEFLNQLCNLLVDGKNSKKFTRIYQRFIEYSPDFSELVIECKKLIMKTSLTGELSTLSNYLNRISEKYYSTRDYTLNGLREALTEIIACFPVYRTYISEEDKGDKAIQYIKWAVGLAKKRTMHTDPSIFDFIEKVLLVELEEDKESQDYKDILNFAMKFQQYTAPLMAKGLEDTSFYRYNKLVALNEVGGEPVHFGITITDFHNQNLKRLERTPHGMLCTSTHDTKRSEDVRARICVLSELPDKWNEKINRWSTMNQSKKIELDKVLAPDKNDEYLFYQSLLGIWPYEDPDEAQKEQLIARLDEYMIKAIRESKVHTSWVNINAQYEEAIKNYIKKVLTSPENHPFWKEFLPFQKDIAHTGLLNSLFQCVLKLTCPGVPDIYQGSEILKFNLVDPDNRRQVDYEYLRQNLSKLNIEELMPLHSGKMKMFLTKSLLNFRQKHPGIFMRGNYIPLEVKGVRSRNIVAFTRQYEDEAIIVIVPRLVHHLVSEEKILPISEKIWKDSIIELPEELIGKNAVDILSDQEFTTENLLNAGKVLNQLPVSVLSIKI